jgi:hypothetical protein
MCWWIRVSVQEQSNRFCFSSSTTHSLTNTYSGKTLAAKDWIGKNQTVVHCESMIDPESAAYLPGYSAPPVLSGGDPSRLTDASSATAVLATCVAVNGNVKISELLPVVSDVLNIRDIAFERQLRTCFGIGCHQPLQGAEFDPDDETRPTCVTFLGQTWRTLGLAFLPRLGRRRSRLHEYSYNSRFRLQ